MKLTATTAAVMLASTFAGVTAEETQPPQVIEKVNVQLSCYDRSNVARRLVINGLSQHSTALFLDTIFETWVADDGRWSTFWTAPDGVACMLGAGEGFEEYRNPAGKMAGEGN